MRRRSLGGLRMPGSILTKGPDYYRAGARLLQRGPVIAVDADQALAVGAGDFVQSLAQAFQGNRLLVQEYVALRIDAP